MTTSRFLIVCLCPGTDTENARAKAAMSKPAFPMQVTVRVVGTPPPCRKCGAKAYKLTTESQVKTEQFFGLPTTVERWVCEGMGGLI